MPYAEIAEVLGIQTGAVKVRIHRALEELRSIFLKLAGEKTSCDAKKSAHILPTI
jgi:DNA-directed RNA polymerase specialized sigma24 family protein